MLRSMNAPVVILDARGLEPPEPMIRILEALNSLPGDAVLQAHTDRRPIHLLPMLEHRGFHGDTTADPERGFITLIRRLP
jgi:hypothetical protein